MLVFFEITEGEIIEREPIVLQPNINNHNEKENNSNLLSHLH